MREKHKDILSSVAQSVLMLLIGGGAVFILTLAGSFGQFPLYVTQMIPIAGGAGVLALLLTVCWDLPAKWNKRIGAVFLLIFAACVIHVGIHSAQSASKNALATLDESNFSLYQYEPYISDSKALVLEEPSSLQFDAATVREIHLDGTSALYPVYASFARNVWPVTGVEMRRHHKDTTIACSGADDAYVRLMKGGADMIFAGAPSQELQKVAQMCGIDLHLTPIGKEAFVFFVHRENPIDGLTTEQIQKIYTGELINWRELGGSARPIRAFQSEENSQTVLEQIMNGLPLMEAETEIRSTGVGWDTPRIAAYRNYENALGFSFRFHTAELVKNDEIKLLAFDGVEPTQETIRSGSYPLSAYFYAVTASSAGQPAPETENRDLAAFLSWILSPQGQEIIEKAGYVPLT